MADVGTDTWCRTTLVTTRRESGRPRIINRICRRLRTPRGSLYFHPGYGLDIESYLGEELTSDRTRRLVRDVAAEVEAESTVHEDSVIVESSETVLNGVAAIDLRIRCTTKAGPLDFVVSVAAVTLELLGVRGDA